MLWPPSVIAPEQPPPDATIVLVSVSVLPLPLPLLRLVPEKVLLVIVAAPPDGMQPKTKQPEEIQPGPEKVLFATVKMPLLPMEELAANVLSATVSVPRLSIPRGV